MIEERFLLCRDLVELVHTHTQTASGEEVTYYWGLKRGVNVAILMDKL